MLFLNLGAILVAGVLMIILSVIVTEKLVLTDYTSYAVVSILISMVVGIVMVCMKKGLTQSFAGAGIALGCMIVISIIANLIVSKY